MYNVTYFICHKITSDPIKDSSKSDLILLQLNSCIQPTYMSLNYELLVHKIYLHEIEHMNYSNVI